MKLENIVLHKIIKDDKTNIPKLNCSDKALSKDSEDILDFVNRFLKVYNKRRPTQGTFQANKDEYPFQKHLFDYINGGDFITFTKKAMETLKKAIDLPTTKGGYVVFMHYVERTVKVNHLKRMKVSIAN